MVSTLKGYSGFWKPESYLCIFGRCYVIVHTSAVLEDLETWWQVWKEDKQKQTDQDSWL